jgi:hypothetical protein
MEASFQGQSGLFAAMTQPQLTCQVFDGPWPVPRPAHQVRDLGDVLSERLARREYRLLRALTELNIPAVEVVGIAVGCVVAAAGFALWAGKVTDLHAGSQVINIVIAGAGMGLLGQANTDAVNRASRLSYGEATGITQTVRNYCASLGFAILGTILISGFRSKITSSLVARGLPPGAASAQASKIAELQGGSGNVATIPQFIRADFAGGTREVLYVMAGIMAATALVALRGLSRGVQQETDQAAGVEAEDGPAPAYAPSSR